MRKMSVIAILAVAAVAVHGQGVVAFQNSISSAIYIGGTTISSRATSATIGAQTGNGSTGVIDVGLVWGTSADSANTLQGIEHIGIHAGILNDAPTSFSEDYALTGTNPGDTVFIQIYCWDSSYGDSLDGMNACVAAGGYFVAASGTPGNYGSIGTPLSFVVKGLPEAGTPLFGTSGNVYGKSAGLFNNMLVVTSPEPATIAFGGLGAAALLMFRRRK